MNTHLQTMSGYTERELYEFMCYVTHEKRDILVCTRTKIPAKFLWRFLIFVLITLMV